MKHHVISGSFQQKHHLHLPDDNFKVAVAQPPRQIPQLKFQPQPFGRKLGLIGLFNQFREWQIECFRQPLNRLHPRLLQAALNVGDTFGRPGDAGGKVFLGQPGTLACQTYSLSQILFGIIVHNRTWLHGITLTTNRSSTKILQNELHFVFCNLY